MSPSEREAQMRALDQFGTSMRRARFMDRLPDEERQHLTIIIGRGKSTPTEERTEEYEESGGGDGDYPPGFEGDGGDLESRSEEADEDAEAQDRDDMTDELFGPDGRTSDDLAQRRAMRERR